MNIFFTSDQHFGHENLMKNLRPEFSSIEEMNEVLINNYNSVVNRNDTVYMLGDFCMHGKELDILKQLNGQIHYILGNHDKKYFKKIISYKKVISVNHCRDVKIDSQKITLCHYPMLSYNCSHVIIMHEIFMGTIINLLIILKENNIMLV